MSNALIQTTYSTRKSLNNQEIVLPSDYSKVFESNAKKYGIDFENEEVILENLNYEETKINKIVDETSHNLNILSSNAKEAQTAIINKDIKRLNYIENDMVKMQNKIEYLQNELYSDPLTKAKNRRWFTNNYLVENRCPSNGCLAFIDLNDFKKVNDNYGHVTGDQVLKYLADFLKKSLPFDWAHVVRYAGDEFIVIFDQEFKDISTLVTKMDTIQKDLSHRTLKSKNIDKLKFGFSYGLSLFNQNDDFDHIIEVADERMYINKKKIKGIK